MATGKGGYDCDFVTPPKSLECPVCLLTLRDPHVISCCGNEFCRPCIQRIQRDGKPCPMCNEVNFTTFLHKKLVREVNALMVRCPHKALGCDWEGELGQLEHHLNPPSPSGGCKFVMIECPFQCGTQFQRQMLREHETESCPKRPIEIQVTSLLKKFEAIIAENRVLRQEIDTMKESHNREIKEMKNTHESELFELKQELADVKDEMKKSFEEKFAALQSHTRPLTLPPFYFTVVNVDYYQKHRYSYMSDPFYSHPGGYKLYVKVSFLDSCNSECMSLHLFILRGEFDDQLPWPFDGEVTIQLYNRTKEEWSTEQSIALNEKECGVDVVKRREDQLAYVGWGHPNFLPYSELKADFQKEANAIRFRVTKVKVFSTKVL